MFVRNPRPRMYRVYVLHYYIIIISATTTSGKSKNRTARERIRCFYIPYAVVIEYAYNIILLLSYVMYNGRGMNGDEVRTRTTVTPQMLLYDPSHNTKILYYIDKSIILSRGRSR